jgi:hypothetical protein
MIVDDAGYMIVNGLAHPRGLLIESAFPTGLADLINRELTHPDLCARGSSSRRNSAK